MSKLTKHQRLVLTTAAGRNDLTILPLPDAVGSAAGKVTAALRAAGFLAERPKHDPLVSRAGLEAIGVAPTAYQNSILASIKEESHALATGKKQPPAKVEPTSNDRRPEKKAPRTAHSKAQRKNAHRPAPGKDTKQAKLIAMLSRPSGATLEQMAKTLGWQHHTVRGAIAGALKKKLGLEVTSEKNPAGNRIYRLASAR
jgi:hypothetical protein